MPTIIQTEKISNCLNSPENFASFLLEPVELGHGITIANTLRRCMLSDLYSFAVTGARINNLQHEFTAIPGIMEDTIEILLNLKKITFMPKNFFRFNAYNASKTANLVDTACVHANGPRVITASALSFGYGNLKVVDPAQHVCTLINNAQFYCELDIEFGKSSAGAIKGEENDEVTCGPKTLKIEPNFCPIIQANYKIKLINDSFGCLKEAIIFDIVTNGTISPKRALVEGVHSAINMFVPFLSSESTGTLSREYLRKFF